MVQEEDPTKIDPETIQNPTSVIVRSNLLKTDIIKT